MKSIIVIIAIMASLFVGCKPSIPQNGMIIESIIVVTDASGYRYQLVEPEKMVDGMTMVALWERIEPLDTKKWYTPTLASKFDTNRPPTFNSLMR